MRAGLCTVFDLKEPGKVPLDLLAEMNEVLEAEDENKRRAAAAAKSGNK